MNDIDIDLARNTPWVDMSACVKFGLDRPSRLVGHTEQTNRQTDKHIAFYYIDSLREEHYKTVLTTFIQHTDRTIGPEFLVMPL